MSGIQAMVYLDLAGKSGDWYVNTTPKSFEGYKEAALDPWFNHIDSLTGGPYNGGTGSGPGPDPGTPPDGTPTTTPPVPSAPGRNGYRILGSDGKGYALGPAKHLRNTPALP